MNLQETIAAQAAVQGTVFTKEVEASLSKNHQYLVGNTNGLKEGETLDINGAKIVMMPFDIAGEKTKPTPCVMAILTKADGTTELFQLSLASLKRQSYGTDINQKFAVGSYPTADVQKCQFSVVVNEDLTKSIVAKQLVVLPQETHLFATFETEADKKTLKLVDGKAVVASSEGNLLLAAKKTTIFGHKA